VFVCTEDPSIDAECVRVYLSASRIGTKVDIEAFFPKPRCREKTNAVMYAKNSVFLFPSPLLSCTKHYKMHDYQFEVKNDKTTKKVHINFPTCILHTTYNTVATTTETLRFPQRKTKQELKRSVCETTRMQMKHATITKLTHKHKNHEKK
jgi:hypothetical protein